MARLVPMPAATIQQILDDGDFKEPLELDHTDLHYRGNEAWEQEDRDDRETRFNEAMAVHDIAAAYVYLWEFSTRARWRQGQ